MPFLKMAFEGFAGDGKTFTATQIAIGLHKKIGSTKPIAIFDTEKAAKALAQEFDRAGIECVVDQDNRSLKSLTDAITWCESGGSDILIIDSITHVWENFLNAYMDWKKRSRLEFQDWGYIKPKWKADFSDKFVNAKVHIIFTGRAGFEYETEINADTQKREIFKSGIKMKAESETQFEPDLLVLMQKQMDIMGKEKTVKRVATILKDRANKIDGKSFENPTFSDFEPAIDIYLLGKYERSEGKVVADEFKEVDENVYKWKKERTSLLAEIDGVFNLIGWGTSKEDKQAKAATLNRVFGKTSTDALDDLKNEQLALGLQVLNELAKQYAEYLANCAETETKPEVKQVAIIIEAIQEAMVNG